jgi:hypothetical protein
MLSPKLTNCPECFTIASLLEKIDCKLSEIANNLYNNISYMLDKSVNAKDMFQLIAYKRILTYRYNNPNYLCNFPIDKITNKVIRLTAGCDAKSKCLPIIKATTTTTTTVELQTITSTTIIPSIPDADYIVFKYNFEVTSGADLDTLTTLYVNGSDVPYVNSINPVGYCASRNGNGNSLGGPNLWWGGDNTGFGTESVYVDITQLNINETINSVQINCRANWYSAIGDGVVEIQMFSYSGGTMVNDGNYGFTNVGGKLLGNYNFPAVQINILNNQCTGTECVGLYGYVVNTGQFTVEPCVIEPTTTTTTTIV